MPDVIRVTSHPRQPGFVVLKFGPDLNAKIGTFQPARQALDLGGYVMVEDQLDALHRWCRFNDARVLDDRNRADPDPSGLLRPQECRHCGRGGSSTNPPRFCPECGEVWEPIAPHQIQFNAPITKRMCHSCGHRNAGRFPFCSQCGASLQVFAVLDGDPRDPLAEIKARVRGMLADTTKDPDGHHLPDPVPVGAGLPAGPVDVEAANAALLERLRVPSTMATDEPPVQGPHTGARVNHEAVNRAAAKVGAELEADRWQRINRQEERLAQPDDLEPPF